jgi:hypothetical protein
VGEEARRDLLVRRPSISLLRWFPLALVAAWLCFHGGAQAKLRPYYVLHGIGAPEIKPRVLFVLDTSGSMSWRSQSSEEQCKWNQCEGTGTSSQSRISTARRAIRAVVEGGGNVASFALMTFGQMRPPTSVPSKCTNGNRFKWSQYHGYFWWDNLDRNAGYYGAWFLCEGTSKRPYPYLRWDGLGVGSVINSDDRVNAVPASPLISTTQANMSSNTNATRRVQWFPKFMGVRTNLNNTTDPDKSILNATIGDYASTNATRLTAVWGQDFYYWPYVDGFPGYSASVGYPAENGSNPRLGVVTASTTYQAALYAPFYLDLPASTPAAVRGPATADEAKSAVDSAVSPLVQGGVDADGGTPWASAIGSTSDTLVESNAVYSHTSVASYLRYVASAKSADVCAPTVAVLVTDGQPSPSSEGGAVLHQRLAALRDELGVKTYVVGFFLDEPELHRMACAAAGACSGSCTTPCDDPPANEWDTCADPNNPAGGCAYLANSASQLAATLTTIVAGAFALELDSGPGTRMQEFGVGANGASGKGEIVQTTLRSYTDYPGWRGHVVRDICDDEDPENPGSPAPWCVDQPFAVGEQEETFGPCPQGRQWDAGVCLQQTSWKARRLFTHDAANQAIAIADEDGVATAGFKQLLVSDGGMTLADANQFGDEVAAFLLGRDFPNGWKLPGLASSAATVIRRIPRFEPSVSPTVSIRDPHCGGRRLSEVDAAGLPDSLEQFARDAWSQDGVLASPSTHHRYQEAVLVGDDLGVLHAFALDSGNELWGLVPRFLLDGVVAQWKNGAGTMGQPANLDEHIYGISATANHGWVYDAGEAKWRHLAVVGLGAGGSELIALDVSHMSPSAENGPVEVLWTSEDAALDAIYDQIVGETWARPALAYEVPGNVLGAEPTTRLVIGSGYPAVENGVTGRSLLYADALTGAVLQQVKLPDPGTRFDTSFGTIVDPAVASHCISRYWGEVQEAYVADPAGRLFRWDLGGNHAADGGATWNGTAIPSASFTACEGAGATCNVGNKGEPFSFAPAVSANGRIDADNGGKSGELPPGVDQFLVALASGNPADDAVPMRTSSFHASLYLLVDDHSVDAHGGFAIPGGAPKLDPASLQQFPRYARVAISDIPRTRTFVPFEGAPQQQESGKFSRGTRPIRAPRIEVTGVIEAEGQGGADPQVIDGVEVYSVTYTLYEPPTNACDERFHDDTTGVWYTDEGATYEVTLRLTAVAGQGFDFTEGAADGPATFPGGTSTGLVLESVTQVADGACADGNCGPRVAAPSMRPCDNTGGGSSVAETRGFAVAVDSRVLSGFSPVE